MARQYTKPMIVFEKLSAGSGASSGCTFDVSFAEFSCPVFIPEWEEYVFTSSNAGCDWSNDNINICYHVPMASFNVYGS